MKSIKQTSLEKTIQSLLSGNSLKAAKALINDKEIGYLQDYANTVSIKRLKYNDHGPVHMRTVAVNALTLLDLLHKAKIKTSLEDEDIGTLEDSRIAVFTAAFLHDLGMTVGRDNHERSGAMLALPIITRLLEKLYPKADQKRVIMRSLIIEGIMGHMGTQKISSIEAGTILVADGCDMEKGRARIPMMIDKVSKAGDIHKYSSAAIKNVTIRKGKKKPIGIRITMAESVGFFQVEDVLLPKINSSPVKPYIELTALVEGEKEKHYLS